MRLRGFPFSPEVDAFLKTHDTVFVVDQNRDGQLRTLLVNDTSAEKAKLISVRHYSGTPLSADTPAPVSTATALALRNRWAARSRPESRSSSTGGCIA